MFQTGPEHPWILDTYAKSAKYPYTSVVAQEIFQSGVIPSDTDFRVFVQYGGLVGKSKNITMNLFSSFLQRKQAVDVV